MGVMRNAMTTRAPGGANKHKQRKHIEIVKKNCRVLVCAAAEYCPLEGYFGWKED